MLIFFYHILFTRGLPSPNKKKTWKTDKSEYPTSESANVSLCIHGVMSRPYFLYYVANETLSRLTSSFLIILTCNFYAQALI